MAHGKQKTQTSGSGKERKETRSERRARLEAEKEARETCFKILPYVAGGIFVLAVIFAFWVRSIPPAVRDEPVVGGAPAGETPPPGSTDL